MTSDDGKKQQIGQLGTTVNSWTQFSVKLPSCDKTKNFAITLMVYLTGTDYVVAFDLLGFTNCEQLSVSYSSYIHFQTLLSKNTTEYAHNI